MEDIVDLRSDRAAKTAPRVVGLSMTVEGDLRRLDRRELALMLSAQFESKVVIMPCGERFSASGETVPTEDLPCPCGNPTHLLVQWTERG